MDTFAYGKSITPTLRWVLTRISASPFGLRTEVRGASVSAELHSPEPLLADPDENASLLYAAQTA